MIASALAGTAASPSPPPTGWHARLALRFERDAARSWLAECRHSGPLRVQKALYPEGPEVCQAVIVHPPGGIVGGDALDVSVVAAPGAHAQVTTPGAAKWYRSAGAVAVATTELGVGAGAVLEWLPQEAIVFDGARATIATRVALDRGAWFVGWDVVALGRAAAGERFSSGCLRQSLEVRREGTLLWCERSVLDGGSPALNSGAVLAGEPVFGTMIVAGGEVPDALLGACRAIAAEGGDGAVTRLPGVLVARYRGRAAGMARTYFALLWRTLRPALLGRVAVPPRIWNT